MRSPETLILEAELLARAPDSVHDWLANYAVTADRFDEKVDIDVERTLLDRQSPLINLGLARFTRNSETARALFSGAGDGDSPQARALRLCILCNESLAKGGYQHLLEAALPGGTQQVLSWLAASSEDELRCLFQNGTIGDSFLINFLNGKEYWQALNEKQQLLALRALSRNTRMRAPYAGDMDGYAEYMHNSVFHAAWALTITLPPTRPWAQALSGLLDRMPPEGYGLDKPLEVAQRWRAPPNDERSLKEDTDVEKIGHLAEFPRVRKALARLATAKGEGARMRDELLASDDPAFRDAAYSSMPITPAQIHAGYARDKNLAVNSCQRNDHIWRDPRCREALHAISWEVCGYNDNDMSAANSFAYFKQERRSAHPEWFAGEDDEAPDASRLPATNADVAALAESVAEGASLARKSMTMIAKLDQSGAGSNNKLGVLVWIGLGALIATAWRHF